MDGLEHAGDCISATRRTNYTTLRLRSSRQHGRVWIVHDDRMRRDVVLKELPDRSIDDTALHERFEREALITAQLEHPNIVPAYEIGRRPDSGAPYYTMRFVQGQTLRESIAQFFSQNREVRRQSMEFRRLLSAFVDVCNAVAYAHSRGVVHRDLKPSNIVLGEFGEVVLLDWGIAKACAAEPGGEAGDSRAAVSVDCDETNHGTVVGTPAYMSPEQARGEVSSIGPQTDVYGLGAILFEILTGRAPHAEWAPGRIVHAVSHLDARRPISVNKGAPRALDAICARAMARSAADRYASASDLVNDIQRWMADESVSVYSPRLRERLTHCIRTHPKLALTGLLALIGLLVFGANLLRLTMHERQNQLIESLAREIELGTEVLHALSSQQAAMGPVSREEFGAFVRPYLDRRKDLQALEWIPVVRGHERAAYERASREAGFRGFQFTELLPPGGVVRAAEREEYYPVYYVEPGEGNEQALGLDLGSCPDRLQALRLAWERGRPVATAPVDLVQMSGEGPGVLIFNAVCQDESTTAGRQEGYALGVYSIERLLNAAWQHVSLGHLVVRVFDVTDPSSPHLLWSNSRGIEQPGLIEADDGRLSGAMWAITRTVDVCGRAWKVTTQARPSFLLHYPFSE